MSINIGDSPAALQPGVVNVGDEITQDQLNAIQGAVTATSSNVFATMADVGGGGGLPTPGDTSKGWLAQWNISSYSWGSTGDGAGDIVLYNNGLQSAVCGNFVAGAFNGLVIEDWANEPMGYAAYTASGIFTWDQFRLPPQVYSIGSNGSAWSTSVGYGGSGMSEHNTITAYSTDIFNTGYFNGVSIGGSPIDDEIGIRFVKESQVIGGANTYNNIVSDFTTYEGVITGQTHCIRIRINGQDFNIPAEYIAPPIPPE